MHTFKISASILSADFAQLGKQVEEALHAGVNWIHLDVMDNHYVPNLTIGPLVCKALRQYGIDAPIDVHLMARPVDHLIENFAKAGASYISIHPESTDHLDRSLQLIQDLGCKAGLVFNPATPFDVLPYVIDKLDLVLLMSVNPGFANQPFIQSSLKKIAEMRQLLDRYGSNQNLSVDGGVKVENIGQIAQAGADTFVIGSAIFDTQNYVATLAKFQAELSKVKSHGHF